MNREEAYGSVVCLHPLVIIGHNGALTRGYLCNCTSDQSEKDLSRIELLHMLFSCSLWNAEVGYLMLMHTMLGEN